MDTQAGSIGTFKQEIKNWIFERFDETTTILDVGPGFGTYYNLLDNRYKNIDAVEIYYPNIIDYELLKKYRFVSCHDIVGFEYEYHDLIIFGDVLEHLTVEDAQKVLKYAESRCKCMIVAVPYRWAQDGHENQYEKHIQDDLTEEVMAERYPDLTPLYSNDHYGFYINKNLENK